MKKCIFVFCQMLLVALTCKSGSLTIVLNQIPANTPANDNIYAAGSFNNWNPASAAHIFAPSGGFQRVLTIPNVSGTVTFKFSRGSWTTVEGNANGGFLPDRTHTVVANDTIYLTIASWEGLSPNGTAAANVQILSNSFSIPELNRTRRIWLYLPPDYTTATAKRYPVLYMHDGQNLFDATTSFSGEWQIDETLNQLHNQGNYGAIVVGIDNGGADRINEYSPWANTQYGGGQGNQYIDFIKNTLKPYIDSNFRTLTTGPNTGIIGSSMGGLISLYANAKYPATFGKAGIFSPAFWIVRNELNSYLNTITISAPIKNYYVAGTTESSSMMSDMQTVRNLMLQKSGGDTSLQRLKGRADGAHSEWFWRREFKDAYLYLFSSISPENVGIESTLENKTISVFPNPSSDYLTLEWQGGDCLQIVLFTTDGKEAFRKKALKSGDTLSLNHLSEGMYIIQLSDRLNNIKTLKWAKCN